MALLHAALRGVPAAVLEEYVQGRITRFVDLLVQRLLYHEPTLSPQSIQLAIKEAVAYMPAAPASPQPEVQQEYQLVFRHDCMALGCLDPQCTLCQHNPQRRCSVNFDRKYLVNDVLKAKCTAAIRVELVDQSTGRLVEVDIPGLRLELCVLDGHAYDTKFVENGSSERGCEPEDELESCCLLLNKKKHGRAVLPDVSITDSSEAILLGRKPPFRLLARAVWAGGAAGTHGSRTPPPGIAIKHAVSEGFVVATRRTRTAGKVDIPSVGDPISKLEHMGKETVKKLGDIKSAGMQVGVEIDIPENTITKVGEFKQLVLRADQDGHLRQRLQHVLKLSKEKWEEAREHALRAVTADSRPRVWYADPLTCSMGLLFACRLGSVDLERPLALMQTINGRLEASPMAQLNPGQRDMVRSMQPQASISWWAPGHQGWAILNPQDLDHLVLAAIGPMALGGLDMMTTPASPVLSAAGFSGSAHTTAGGSWQGNMSMPGVNPNTVSNILRSSSGAGAGMVQAARFSSTSGGASALPMTLTPAGLGPPLQPAGLGPGLQSAGLGPGLQPAGLQLAPAGLGLLSSGGGSALGLQPQLPTAQQQGSGAANAALVSRGLNPFGDIVAKTVRAGGMESGPGAGTSPTQASGGGGSSLVGRSSGQGHLNGQQTNTSSAGASMLAKRSAHEMDAAPLVAQRGPSAAGPPDGHRSRTTSNHSGIRPPSPPPPLTTSSGGNPVAGKAQMMGGSRDDAGGLRPAGTPGSIPVPAPPSRSPPLPATDTHQLGHAEPKDTLNPFASAMAAAHVAAGASNALSAQLPPGYDLDLSALPSMPFSPSIVQQFLGSLVSNTSQPPSTGGFHPNMTHAAAQELKGLPSLGLGVAGMPGSADLDAMLINIGASNAGMGGLSDQMETSLTSLDLFSKHQLQMISQQMQSSGGGGSLQPTATTNWIPPLFFPNASEHQHQQQGLANAAAEDSWLGNALQSIQPVQGTGGDPGRGEGPGAMDALASVASGLDNMQSIEQALPNIDGDVSLQFINAAQVASTRTSQQQAR